MVRQPSSSSNVHPPPPTYCIHADLLKMRYSRAAIFFFFFLLYTDMNIHMLLNMIAKKKKKNTLLLQNFNKDQTVFLLFIRSGRVMLDQSETLNQLQCCSFASIFSWKYFRI